MLLTRAAGPADRRSPATARRPRSTRAREPFELLAPVTLYTAHNGIGFHTWSDDECCLPQGATQAFLRDDEANRLRLRAGDVLVLEALASTTHRRRRPTPTTRSAWRCG